MSAPGDELPEWNPETHGPLDESQAAGYQIADPPTPSVYVDIHGQLVP